MVILLCFVCFLLKFAESSDVGLNPVEIIEKHGYQRETHFITTEDGYILTYYRIPNGILSNSSDPKPIALLQHGFLSSAADYVNMGPGRSLGFILADLGYDVWIGNSRGNTFSKNHTKLNPILNRKEFYDFSWHEMGYYDYPAAVDYILDLTSQESLFFVGHSQATTAFLVLASSRPEYNSKIRLASLLAPAGFIGNPPNPSVKFWCQFIDQYAALWELYQYYDIPNTEAARIWGSTTCTLPVNYPTCEFVYYTTMGIDIEQVESKMLPVIATNAPADAATKQLVHYGQIIKTGEFVQFDFGFAANLAIYGSATPPSYDLAKVTAPIAFYYAANDGLLSIQDVKHTISEVANSVHEYLVPLDSFNHYDFLFAQDVLKLVYSDLVNIMKEF